jgi:hypothetical protein
MTAEQVIADCGITLSLYHGPRELWYRKFASVASAREYLAANKPTAQHRYGLPDYQWLDQSGDSLIDPHGQTASEIRRMVFASAA